MNRFTRAGLWVLGILILVIGGWQIYKYRLVHKGVEKVVTEKMKGLYSIKYEGLVIDELSGALHVKNIEIEPDTAMYNQMVENKTAPSVLLRLSIPALNIAGVKTPKALLNKQIEGRTIEIANPRIGILLNKFSKDSTVHDPSRELSRELLGKLLKIQIDSIKVSHAHVTVQQMHADAELFGGDDVSFVLSDLLIDSLAEKDSSRILFARNLDMDCGQLQLPSKNKKYKLHVAGLRFSSRDNGLEIGQFRLAPQLPEAAFAASFPVQKDRYDFNLRQIRLVHMDRVGLWHKRLEADSMIIGESSFKIYRDLSHPRDTVSKMGRYPQQQLMQVPIPIHIRQVVFLHSFIEYKEKNAKSDSAGKLQFYDAHAKISNVTNMENAIARDNKCILVYGAKLLDKAPVDAKLVMLLKDPKGRFSIDGNIGALDVVSLNPLTEPMGLARMEKGHIERLHFYFEGTDSSSQGNLTMLYDGLKISLLKKDKEDNEYDKKGLASMLANLIMKKSNPGNGGEPRTAQVHFDRMMDKSFFNLIWKSIFTGIKKNAGVR